MNIYSNKFANLCIFVGEYPEGKILDIDATDKNLQKEIDRLSDLWLEENPDPADRYSEEHDELDYEERDEWLENQRIAYDRDGIKLLESKEWYENAYVWIDG